MKIALGILIALAGGGSTIPQFLCVEDFIRANSAPGSRVIYDYLLREVVEGRYEGFYAAESIAEAVARRGEPYVTGTARTHFA